MKAREETRLSAWGEACAGGFSGAISRLLVAPLDVIKIRLQLQVLDKATGNVEASSIKRIVRGLLQEEGLKTLWRGNIAAMALWTTYTAVQFPLYAALKRRLAAAAPDHAAWNSFVPILAGGVAGSVATTVTYPFDWIRTRFASQGMPKVYSSMWDMCTKQYAVLGPRAFFQGLVPTVLAVSPQFFTYDSIVSAYKKQNNIHVDPGVLSVLAGAAAGTCGKMSVYPLDTVKKRLQVVDMPNIAKYGQYAEFHGMLQTLFAIAKREGVMALYRGTLPSLMKSAVGVALTFWSFEAASRTLARFPAFQTRVGSNGEP